MGEKRQISFLNYPSMTSDNPPFVQEKELARNEVLIFTVDVLQKYFLPSCRWRQQQQPKINLLCLLVISVQGELIAMQLNRFKCIFNVFRRTFYSSICLRSSSLYSITAGTDSNMTEDPAYHIPCNPWKFGQSSEDAPLKKLCMTQVSVPQQQAI